MWATLAQIALIPVAVLFASVFLVALGTPWIAAAWVVAYLTRGRMPDRARVAIVSLIVACGIAPLVYAHGVINVYIVAMDGGQPPLGSSLISILATWLIAFTLGLVWLAKRPARSAADRTDLRARSPLVLGAIAIAGVAILAVLTYRWYVDKYGDAHVRVVTVGEPPVAELSLSSGTCPTLQPRISGGTRVYVAECVLSSRPTRIAVRCPDPSLPDAFIEHAFEPRASSNYVLFENVCESSPQQILDANRRATGTSVWRANPRPSP